ncbi:cfap-36 [Pristionchus pacificus]|uniref:Cilia- and flagella-associated protein 36 n=1 Tax=Pristionchus pacificus TaxID=54126 RepID=A0A2A6C9M2_PRIPA|nr:cfap-36 [Pristionchus pacificus]|eukprot:PDM74912.1 hypothetical protein PRIPAC_40293 [Pristionchus pacificus]
MPPMRSRKNSRTSSTTSSSSQHIINKLLDFLDSSIWHLPIETFVEQQSIVFDRQQEDSELYMRIHLDYRNLVDTLLECFCEDSGIRPDELIASLEKINKEKLSAKAKAAYEPLAAAQNYLVFVPMMMRKNVELQLQALQMIEFMCGIIPTVLKVEDTDSWRDRVVNDLSKEDAEKFVLLTVLRQSRDEFESAQQSERKELEAMLRAENFDKDRARLIAEVEKEGKEMEAALALPISAAPPPSRKYSRPPIPTQFVVQLKNENVDVKEVNEVKETKEKREVKEIVVQPEEKRERAKSRGREDSRDKDRPLSRAPSAKGDRKISVERKTSVTVVTVDKRPPTGEKRVPPSREGERRPSTSTRTGTAKTKKPLAKKSSSVKSAAEPSIESIDDGIEGKKGRTAADIRALFESGDQLDPEMLAKRAEYLREQRDKLTKLKQAEREKQFALNATATQERPKTAKAARGMMRGGKGEGGGEEIIAARKALVEKLKENV